MASRARIDTSVNLSMGEKGAYMLGGIGQQLANKTISQYLLLFFTNCLLLSPATAGAIFMYGRIVDAVTDIIMANVSDKTRTRWGAYRPYILFGCLPLAIVFVMCFTVPSFLATNGQKLVWAYVMYFLEGSVLNTVCGMNYGALASVMTSDRNERAQLGTARSIGESIATLLISSLTMTIVVKYGGDSNPAGWTRVAVIFAFIIAITYLICFAMTKERVVIVSKGRDSRPLRERAKCLKGNVPFYGILLCIVCLMFTSVFAGTTFAYFCIYNLGHKEWIAPLTTIGAVISIGGAFTVPFLAKKIEKRFVMIISAALWIAASIILAISSGYFGALLYQIVSGCASAIGLAVLWSIVPETAEYGEWKNGVASPGLVYSICMFMLKVTTGFATYGVTAILSLTGFDPKIPAQTASVLSGIRIGIVVVPAIMSVLVIAFTFCLRSIDKMKFEIISAELAQRRNKSE